MNIILRENQFNLMLRRMLSEMIYSNNSNLLVEGDSRLKKIITQIMPNAFNGLLDVNTQVSGPEYYVNGNPNTTWGEYLLFNLRHTFGLMGNSDVPLLLYIAPIAWGDEVKFDKTNDNGTQVAELLQICQLLKKDKALFEKVKNTCGSFSELHDLCAPVLEELKNAEDAEINNGEYASDNGYEIKKVGFEEAHEIGKYSAFQGSGNLCYTQRQSTWDSYTNDGKNTVYVCLKDGWQDMEPEPGSNAPYDEYGLSMIFVFVDPKNNIVYSNTRWNHEYSNNISVDHAFTKAQLSQIVGCNFYDVFKSDNPELPPKELTALAERIYSSGEMDKKFQLWLKISGLMSCLKLHDMYNFINTNTGKIIFSNRWFDDIDILDSGYVEVTMNDKRNLVTPKGTLLWQGDWFDRIYIWGDGYFRVFLNDKCNILTPEGILLWQGDTWFDWISPPNNGYFEIELGKKWNVLTPQGTWLWQGDTWFDGLTSINTNNGNANFYKVLFRNSNKPGYNVLTSDGKLLFPYNFSGVHHFSGDLWAVNLPNNGKSEVNLWDTTKDSFVWPENMDMIGFCYSDGERKVYEVFRNDLINIVDMSGRILSPIWFQDIDDKGCGLPLIVQNDDYKYNLLRYDGTLVSKDWFSGIGYTSQDGWAIVRIKNVRNVLLSDGTYLFDQWTPDISREKLQASLPNSIKKW